MMMTKIDNTITGQLGTKKDKQIVAAYLDGTQLSNKNMFKAKKLIKESFSGLNPESSQALMDMLEEYAIKGSSDLYYDILSEDYIREPVDPETFILGEEYMGSHGRGLYPKNVETLLKALDPKNGITELLLTGGIGYGKSTIAEFALVYKLYRLSCLKNPAEYFGLMKDSQIVFGIFNVHKYKGDKAHGDIRAMIDGSPYFRQCFPRQKDWTKALNFNNGISFIVGAEEISALGENVFSLMIDEVNFMSNSGNVSDDESSLAQSQAQRLYTATSRRLESRFMRHGETPGIIVILSSKQAETSWMEVHLKKVQDRKGVFVVSNSRWGVQPENYSGKMFNVMLGNDNYDPKILGDDEIAPPGTEVIEVPIEHYDSFNEKSDIEKAIRDLAGRATKAVNPLIRKRQRILDMASDELVYPFTKKVISISDEDSSELRDYLDQDKLVKVRHGSLVPRFHSSDFRVVHVDLSTVNCSTGFCMGHGRVEVNEHGFKMPYLYVDLIVEIKPPDIGEIDFEKIRNFIKFLDEIGYPIKLVSFDGWQSKDCQQRLNQYFGERCLTKELSVDTNDTPYLYAKSLIDNGCVSCYSYEPLFHQLRSVQRDFVKKKVTKDKKDFKDVSDAFAGVAYHIMSETDLLYGKEANDVLNSIDILMGA